MKIEAIIALSQAHFAEQQHNRHNVRKILSRYALDELRLHDPACSTWIKENGDGPKGDYNLSTYRDFYLWYYGNYVPISPKEGSQTLQELPNPTRFKKELLITRYVVIKVKALVEENSEEEAIRQWESDCCYDLPGIDEFVIMETEFMGTTEIYPDCC
jgi:hypothetical protein